jgi:hypothetical protein
MSDGAPLTREGQPDTRESQPLTRDGRPLTRAEEEQELTLLDLLDRVLDKGVVLSGDVTLSVADVDLVYVGLRVLLSSVDAIERSRGGSV